MLCLIQLFIQDETLRSILFFVNYTHKKFRKVREKEKKKPAGKANPQMCA